MDFLPLIAIAIGLSLVMMAAWAIQRATGSSGWIDTIWSFAVGAGGIAAAILAEGEVGRRVAIFLIIAAWSVRLGTHIGSRTKGASEDPRYAKLMEEWGRSAGVRLFVFLQVQALAAFALVLSIYLASAQTAPFPRAIDIIAILIAIAAIAGEGLADAQLSGFRNSPKAKDSICEVGLWRYSRHPNYFFEWLFWCAWPLLAIDFSSTSAWGWLALIAPAQMYLLLVHVSGIPPLEEHMLRSRGDKFRALQARVNAFFPGPRRSGGDIKMEN